MASVLNASIVNASQFPLNDGWTAEVFPETEKTAARKLKNVRLPHNFDDYHGMRGYIHGNLHGSAIYRRSFNVPSLENRRSFLVFEGVGTYLTVRLNGREICTRKPAGRLVSTIETTGIAQEGANALEVVCDHPSEIQDMPWHCGGCSGIGSEGPEPFGLFRKVRFETSDLVRIVPFGVHIWHDKELTKCFVETEVSAVSGCSGPDVYERELLVGCSELGFSAKARLSVPPGGAVTNRMEFALTNFEKWTTKNPKLYSFEVTVGSEKVVERTGFASYRWPIPPCLKTDEGEDEHRFILSGEPVFLHGTCETDNRFGGAVSFADEEIDARCREVVKLGFNAWRDGHEPHDLRYGRHWDETGVVWWPQMSTHVFFDTPEFKRNMLAAIEQWVRERRNSPSVVLWGLQNESVINQDFAEECTALIHRLDPMSGKDGRAVTTCNYGQGTDWNVIQNWCGCYSGELRNYQAELCRTNQLLNGEYGFWRVRGYHSDPDRNYTKSDVWTEEHAAHVLWQKMLRAWDVRDLVCGHFLWTLFSHESPGRARSIIDEGYSIIDKFGPLNNKGLLTLDGRRTVAWYLYRSYGEHFKNGTLEDVRYRRLSEFIEEGRALESPKRTLDSLDLRTDTNLTYYVRLNCGGDVVQDSVGNLWEGDSTAYSHSWAEDADLATPGYTINPLMGSSDVVDGAVVNAAERDAALFGTYRYGRHRLSFALPAPKDADCVLEMYFVEPGSYGRVFDIAVNGMIVAKDFNLGAVPERNVVKREFPVRSDGDGRVVVSFPFVACNQAVVSAIALKGRISDGIVRNRQPGYPYSAGRTWASLRAIVRVNTTSDMLPKGAGIKLAPVTPLAFSRPDRHGMKAVSYILRCASDYAVVMQAKGKVPEGAKMKWRLENMEGDKCFLKGEFAVPTTGGRFEVPLGEFINAGYYVFCYRCDEVTLDSRYMK